MGILVSDALAEIDRRHALLEFASEIICFEPGVCNRLDYVEAVALAPQLIQDADRRLGIFQYGVQNVEHHELQFAIAKENFGN